MIRKILILSLLSIIVLTGCTGIIVEKQDNKQNLEPIKIGATFPLTGDLAMYGEAYRDGVLMAQDEINRSGGINNRVVEIKMMDNRGDTKVVASDVNYLINIEKVPVILNSFEYLTMASRNIIEQSHIPMVTFTVYRFSETDKPVYTFRDYWDMGKIGLLFAGAANSNNSQKIGLISLEDTSHVYLKENFEEWVGGTIIIEELFQYGNEDFKTQLLKLKSADIDTILIYGLPGDVSMILKQMSELNMDNYITISLEATEDFVTVANREFLQETKTISYLGSRLSEENQEFIEKYQVRYKKYPRPDALYVYEEVKLLVDILGRCSAGSIEQTRECVRGGLVQTGEFDEYNNRYRDLPLVRYNNGWKIYLLGRVSQ